MDDDYAVRNNQQYLAQFPEILAKLKGIDEYVSIGLEDSTLDGHFTSDQLRRIADAMDALKATGKTWNGEEWV